MSEILLTEQAAGVTPGAGKRTVYCKPDGKLYFKGSTGAEDALQSSADKDASGGYAGLTLFALNLKNAAGTVTSRFTTAATAARTWTMPDKDGTVAMVSDITGGTVAGSFTTLAATSATLGAGSAGASLILARDAGVDFRTSQGTGITYLQQLVGTSIQTLIGTTPITNVASTGLAVTGALSSTGALTTAGMKEDANGNLGLGVVPSAWSASAKAIQIGAYSGIYQNASGLTEMSFNSYQNASNTDTYRVSANAAAKYQIGVGTHQWYTAPSGTAGAPITFTQAMTLDASGNLLVGAAAGSYHGIYKPAATSKDTGVVVFETAAYGSAGVAVYSTSGAYGNAANTTLATGRDFTTNRSINAAGTINASGADYAEYERNNGITFIKGAIVGFKADGTLTNVYADAVRFAIKSTNPSYVGGDTWGSEDQVGKRPDEPQRIADKTEQRELTAAIPATETKPAQEATYETVVTVAGDTDAQWASKQAAYATAKAAFEVALEAARQLVDRIAYSGKVPCNVQGSTPGGYIIAVDNAGAIAGQFVADPDFSQYKKSVGRVNRLLPDGRCEVAVIIH